MGQVNPPFLEGFRKHRILVLYRRMNWGIKNHQQPRTTKKLGKAQICNGGAWGDLIDLKGTKPFASSKGCI